MRITGFEAIEATLPSGREAGRGLLVLKLFTNEGITGVSYHSSKGRELTKGLLDRVCPAIVGSDPAFIREVRSKLSGHYNLAGIPVMAFAMIDLALWDIKGKSLGRPVYQLLGASRDRMPCYATVGTRDRTIEQIRELVHQALALNLKGVKMYVGGPYTLEQDLERLQAIRAIVGDTYPVMIDCSQLFTFAEARRRALAYQEYNPFWIEEAFPAYAVGDFVRLTQATTIPVATGEHISYKNGFAELIARGGVHILQPDLHFCGGLTDCLEIAALGDAFNITVATHGTTAWPMTIHALCTIPNALIGEWSFTQGPHTLMLNPAQIKDGYLYPSTSPGLGVDFDEELLGRQRVA